VIRTDREERDAPLARQRSTGPLNHSIHPLGSSAKASIIEDDESRRLTGVTYTSSFQNFTQFLDYSFIL
jgi:hypothetical protein